MTIEQNIAEMMQKKLEDGSIEKIIEEKLTKCIGECMNDLFTWAGDAKKLINEKLKKVMIPAIENHNFSDYTLKLDAVLTEIVNSTSLQDNKKILDNFKELMIEDKKEINLSEIFNVWGKFVAKNVDTGGLEVEYDDDVSYESVSIESEIEDIKSVSKNSPERKTVIFSCGHDEDMNFQFDIYKYDFMKGYEIANFGGINITQLAVLDEMQVFLLKLNRCSCKITIDKEYMSDEIVPEKKPELTYE